MRLIRKVLCTTALTFLILLTNAEEKSKAIHMINDVSHHYSFFYAWSNKANFGGQHGYVNKEEDQQFTHSLSTISALNLKNYNLFNLYLDLGYDEPYSRADYKKLDHFVRKEGGGLNIVLAGNSDRQASNANAFIKQFGVQLSNETMVKPLAIQPNTYLNSESSFTDIGKGRTLILENPKEWIILCTDANKKPVMAFKKHGKGHIAVSSFTPFIKKAVKGIKIPEDYRFPNYKLTQELFKHLTSGKTIDSSVTLPKKISPDKVIQLEAIEILCSDYSERFAQNVVRDYHKVYNYIQEYMGVPLAVANANNKLKIHLLPCEGSGWSTGQNIAIGMYAPTFIGILGHEMTHSWVLPHSEPLSNEGIAIWIGNKTCIAMGETEKGEGQINNRINGALKDPLFKEWDPVTLHGEMAGAKYSKTLKHGKYMYVCQTFEKKYGEAIIAKYFQLKRQVVPVKGYKFTCHDSAWLWSQVTGEEQFTFFNSIGISVDKEKVSIPNS